MTGAEKVAAGMPGWAALSAPGIEAQLASAAPE
jgi:hypothetical protein